MAELDTESPVHQFKRVVALAVEYHDEAVRCAESQTFRAACVMIGAAAEAVLPATAMIFEGEIRQAGRWPAKKGALTTWNLQKLLALAVQEHWLPAHDPDVPIDLERAKAGDVVDFLRWLRNVVIHPGREVRGLGATNFTVMTYRNGYGILRTGFDETYARIQSLP